MYVSPHQVKMGEVIFRGIRKYKIAGQQEDHVLSQNILQPEELIFYGMKEGSPAVLESRTPTLSLKEDAVVTHMEKQPTKLMGFVPTYSYSNELPVFGPSVAPMAP